MATKKKKEEVKKQVVIEDEFRSEDGGPRYYTLEDARKIIKFLRDQETEGCDKLAVLWENATEACEDFNKKGVHAKVACEDGQPEKVRVAKEKIR